MKLGIAGTGKVVEQFLPVIAELPEIQVTAINSTPKSVDKAIAFQKQYGIDQVYSDYNQFLTEADIDTVYVAVINNLHFSFAKEALLHGKHVICEKPFTMSQKELIELERLSIDYDLV
ncbi:Gfo/Idh/MocA family protein, partial [Aerococcus urinaeequi]|uniref:Gfo/Idh/MocA family protein n=2 Tax=Aerococcaceae TaxID=186827 RepID=UPI003ED941A2